MTAVPLSEIREWLAQGDEWYESLYAEVLRLRAALRQSDEIMWAFREERDRALAALQQRDEALADLQRLVAMSVTEYDHECRGLCPDIDPPGLDSRDPDCLACAALDFPARSFPDTGRQT